MNIIKKTQPDNEVQKEKNITLLSETINPKLKNKTKQTNRRTELGPTMRSSVLWLEQIWIMGEKMLGSTFGSGVRK